MKVLNTLFAAASLFTTVALAGSPVNVNSASAEEIAQGLDGVGQTKAQAIVEYRDANGPFGSPEALTAVKGIGEATVEKNEGFILLD